MTNSRAAIGVVGAGYVGLATAACFAELGHPVRVYEIDESKVAQLQAGRSPIYEAGLEELLNTHQQNGTLSFTTDVAAAIAPSQFVFLCVPTPATADGSADTSYLRQASVDIAAHLAAGAIIINNSTVPVGSTEIVRNELQRADIAVASNPEFLREGTALDDFMHPDRVVIGCTDPDAAERVAQLYAPLQADMVVTDPASAELIKYASNAYLATRLSFVNAVAEVCEVLGGDIEQVARGIGLDKRIGPHFLRPGPGWGGSCFPKDTRALVTMAKSSGFDFTFLRAVIDSNEQQFDRIAAKAVALLPEPAPGAGPATIGVWGLAFKAGTDDVRNSPAVEIVHRLIGSGARVRAFDPKARYSTPGLTQVDDAYAAVSGADLLVLLTEWPEFAELDPARVADLMAQPRVLDARNLLDMDAWTAAGFVTRSIGRPASPAASSSSPEPGQVDR